MCLSPAISDFWQQSNYHKNFWKDAPDRMISLFLILNKKLSTRMFCDQKSSIHLDL